MSDFWILLQSHFLIKPRQLNKHVVVWNTNIYEQTAAHLSIDSKIEMTQDRQLPNKIVHSSNVTTARPKLELLVKRRNILFVQGTSKRAFSKSKRKS